MTKVTDKEILLAMGSSTNIPPVLVGDYPNVYGVPGGKNGKLFAAWSRREDGSVAWAYYRSKWFGSSEYKYPIKAVDIGILLGAEFLISDSHQKHLMEIRRIAPLLKELSVEDQEKIRILTNIGVSR